MVLLFDERDLRRFKKEARKTSVLLRQRRRYAAKKAVKVGAIIGLTGAALLTGGAALGAGGAAKAIATRAVAKRLAIAAAKKITFKKAALGLTAAGILTSSPKARTFVKELPKKLFEKGEYLGAIIEDPKKAPSILGIKETMTTKEKIAAAAKRIGITGAVVGTGVLAAKEIIKRRRGKALIPTLPEVKGIRALGFTEPRPVGLGGVPIIQASPMPVGAPGAPLTQPPLQNIIQISVR